MKPSVHFSELQAVHDSLNYVSYVRLELKCMPTFLYSRIEVPSPETLKAVLDVSKKSLLAQARAIRDELNTLDLDSE